MADSFYPPATTAIVPLTAVGGDEGLAEACRIWWLLESVSTTITGTFTFSGGLSLSIDVTDVTVPIWNPYPSIHPLGAPVERCALVPAYNPGRYIELGSTSHNDSACSSVDSELVCLSYMTGGVSIGLAYFNACWNLVAAGTPLSITRTTDFKYSASYYQFGTVVSYDSYSTDDPSSLGPDYTQRYHYYGGPSSSLSLFGYSLPMTFNTTSRVSWLTSDPYPGDFTPPVDTATITATPTFYTLV